MAAAPAPDRPYLDRLQTLIHAYPPLSSFLNKILNERDAGRQLVSDHYARTPQGIPGRCLVLSFGDHAVSQVDWSSGNAGSPALLSDYLAHNTASTSRESGGRRLFILEDLNPDYVDILGEHLGIDPLVFSEQMNTWNYSDASSIPYRGLPSVSTPKRSFTLRYYEIRTLRHPYSVDQLTFQTTFAVNRRRYERWRDVDLPLEHTNQRHAFARRCASFWTSQDPDTVSGGWDAVIMVDPGMTIPDHQTTSSLILQSPHEHENREALWNARVWDQPGSVHPVFHESQPYHDGCPALAPLLFPHASPEARARFALFTGPRYRTSPLDEQLFYWTQIATKELIAEANLHSCNTTYYLLKHIAQHWTSQLELINCTVAVAEWFSDDYQAKTDQSLNGSRWRNDLAEVNNCTKDINYVRRQMNHFWRAMVLNLERLGVQLGIETVDDTLPSAISGAQKDFLTIHARMDPLRQRVLSLATMATDLASLQAAFKGTHDSEFSLRLGVFASTVFPVTPFASIFSMGDEFLPGRSKFWIFLIFSIPMVFLSAILLRYGIGRRYIVKRYRDWKAHREAAAGLPRYKWYVQATSSLWTLGMKLMENRTSS